MPAALLCSVLLAPAPAVAAEHVETFTGGQTAGLRASTGLHDVVASGTGVHVAQEGRYDLSGALLTKGGLAHVAWDGTVTEPFGPDTWGTAGVQGLAPGAAGATAVALTRLARGAEVRGTSVLAQLDLGSAPADAVVEADGTRWFSLPEAEKVVRWPVTGAPEAFAFAPVNGMANAPSGLVLDAAGRVWVTLHGTQRLGVYDPAAPIPAWQFVQLPATSKVRHLALGADGRVWGTDEKADVLHAVTPATRKAVPYTYSTAKGGTALAGIAAAPDGLLYFAVGKGARLGRMAVDGTLRTDVLLSLAAEEKVEGVGVGGDGNLWFTAAGTPGRVGRVVMPPAGSPVSVHTDGSRTWFRATVHPRARATSWAIEYQGPGGTGQVTGTPVPAGPSAVRVEADVPGDVTGPVDARVVATNVGGTGHGPGTTVDPTTAQAPPADPPPADPDPGTTQATTAPVESTPTDVTTVGTTQTGTTPPAKDPVPVTPAPPKEDRPQEPVQPTPPVRPAPPVEPARPAQDGGPATPASPGTEKGKAEEAASRTKDAEGFDAAGEAGPGGGAAPPQLGKRVAVAPKKGKVLVTLPGRRTPIDLSEADDLPLGAVLDTRRGTVRLRSAVDADGTVQTAEFWGGVFAVQQSGAITELHLRGPREACPKPGALRPAAARRKGKRRLWGKDRHGKFRTHGRDSVATVRGTEWLVEETCRGTTTKVREGAVAVKDKRTKKTVLVRAGRSHFVPRAVAR